MPSRPSRSVGSLMSSGVRSAGCIFSGRAAWRGQKRGLAWETSLRQRVRLGKAMLTAVGTIVINRKRFRYLLGLDGRVAAELWLANFSLRATVRARTKMRGGTKIGSGHGVPCPYKLDLGHAAVYE